MVKPFFEYQDGVGVLLIGGKPNGVINSAKNQMTGPPTVPALSSMTPGVTMLN
jgi:hypothetical protein